MTFDVFVWENVTLYIKHTHVTTFNVSEFKDVNTTQTPNHLKSKLINIEYLTFNKLNVDPYSSIDFHIGAWLIYIPVNNERFFYKASSKETTVIHWL